MKKNKLKKRMKKLFGIDWKELTEEGKRNSLKIGAHAMWVNNKKGKKIEKGLIEDCEKLMQEMADKEKEGTENEPKKT